MGCISSHTVQQGANKDDILNQYIQSSQQDNDKLHNRQSLSRPQENHSNCKINKEQSISLRSYHPHDHNLITQNKRNLLMNSATIKPKSNNICKKYNNYTIKTQDTFPQDYSMQEERPHYINVASIHKNLINKCSNKTSGTPQKKEQIVIKMKKSNSGLQWRPKQFSINSQNNQQQGSDDNKMSKNDYNRQRGLTINIINNNDIYKQTSLNNIPHYRSPRGSKNNLFRTFKDNKIQDDQ